MNKAAKVDAKVDNSIQKNESADEISIRIKRALSRTDNQFALFFALVNFPEATLEISQKLIQQIEEQTHRPVIELSLKADELKQSTLDSWLKQQLEQAPKDAIIFLYNFSELLPSDKKAPRKNLQQLNWRRSSLAAIKRPLVIWLPRYAIDTLAEYAPDFYDWYSNIYDYSTDTKTLEAVEKQLIDSHSGDVAPAERMSQQEKQQWIHTLHSLLDENTQRNKHRAKLLNDLGRLYKSLGQLENALEHYQESLEIQQEIGDKKGEGTTLNNISQIYSPRGDYETALRYLQQSLKILQEIGDKKGEGTTLNNISQIYFARGDYETALSYCQQSLKIQQEIGDKFGEGSTLNNISQIYQARGDYETALRYLQQSLKISQEIGDKSGEGTTLNNMATTAYARDDYETALSYCQQSLKIQQEIGDKSGEGTTLNNISQIYSARGDYETALSYLQQSLKIRQEIGDSAGLCATLFNMGHIYHQNEQVDEAMKAWVNVYKMAKPMNLAQVLEALAGLAPQLGMAEGLDDWEKLAQSGKFD